MPGAVTGDYLHAFLTSVHSVTELELRRPGAYFITICTAGRQGIFGAGAVGEMRLSTWGQVAAECWAAIPDHFPAVTLDAFVIMPNHVHGILFIAPPTVGATHVWARHAAPIQSTQNVLPGSLGAIVRSYKSAVTKRLNEIRGTAGAPIWQRNYYEHIVRNERELTAIRRYIENNPRRWSLDRDNAGNTRGLPPPSQAADYLRDLEPTP